MPTSTLIHPVATPAAPKLPPAPAVFLASVSAVLPGLDVPGAVMTNADLARLMAEVREAILAETGREIPLTTEQFPLERVGIESRRVLDRSLTSADLAREAGRRALEQSGVDPAAVRFLVVATVTPDRVVPSMAACLQHELGLPNDLMAFDMTQGCAGFVTVLELGQRLLRSAEPGSAALVIGADAMTRVLDASDRATCTIFGDGAGAVVLSRETGLAQLVAARNWTDGSGSGRIEIRTEPGSTEPLWRFTAVDGQPAVERDLRSQLRVRMDGTAVYREMLLRLPERVSAFLEAQGCTPDDVDHFVFHQANRRLVEGIAKHPKLGIDPARLPLNIDRMGNTTSASVPILLHSLKGSLREGDLVLCTAFGTGYSVGCSLLRWLA